MLGTKGSQQHVTALYPTFLFFLRLLSVSAKSDSINERTQEYELIKLHILGVWQNARECIR